MKATKKYMVMEIEFNDYSDLKRAFNKAWESMKYGKDWNRFKAGSAICQYTMEQSYDDQESEERMDYQEKMINGKLCMVIQSRMNGPKKIKAKNRNK